MPAAGQSEGAKVLSVADERWKRCWIKSIALLANVLAKNAAVAVLCHEGPNSGCAAGIVTPCRAAEA